VGGIPPSRDGSECNGCHKKGETKRAGSRQVGSGQQVSSDDDHSDTDRRFDAMAEKARGPVLSARFMGEGPCNVRRLTRPILYYRAPHNFQHFEIKVSLGFIIYY